MKKVKWIALALVLCLGLVGGAYAAWTDQIFMRGYAQMGDIDVKYGELDENGGEVGDYSWTASTSSNKRTLNFSMTNAYPGAEQELQYTVHNYGSLPVKLTGIVTDYDSSLIAITNTLTVDKVLGPGESTTETVTLRAGANVTQKQKLDYTVDLNWGLAVNDWSPEPDPDPDPDPSFPPPPPPASPTTP